MVSWEVRYPGEELLEILGKIVPPVLQIQTQMPFFTPVFIPGL